MERIRGRIRHYDWGSESAVANFFAFPPCSQPVAEVWFGAHPLAPAYILDNAQSSQHLALEPAQLQEDPDADLPTLEQFIATAPGEVLGQDVMDRFGRSLPFLLKLVAPQKPLSLQVHPNKEQALAGFTRENAMEIPVESLQRNYRDTNHKPELIYVLERFEALVGFRSPRRILGVLSGLDTPVTQRLHKIIARRPNQLGVRAAFNYLISEDSAPSAAEVEQVVAACAARLVDTSPSPRADAIVGALAKYHPGDPGVVASLLLNPVTLQPGEALFVPVGTVHAYLSGLAIEVMANSDNVLRAGLTTKYVDPVELGQIIDTVAAPPIRIAPERVSPVQSIYYAPVDDFELSVVEIAPNFAVEQEELGVYSPYVLRGNGARIVFVVAGNFTLTTASQELYLRQGQAVFITASDAVVYVAGQGKLVQADVP